jgi:hypothetical protein
MIAILTQVVAVFLIVPAAADRPQQKPRRILKPDQNLADHLKQFRSTADAGGFTIEAKIQEEQYETFAETTETRTILIDVVTVKNPAVTPDTVIERDGKTSLVEYDTLKTLLVSDTSTSRGRESFVLLSFDPKSEDWYGIVDNDANGGYYKVGQENGGTAQAIMDIAGLPPAWECAVGDGFAVDENGVSIQVHYESLHQRTKQDTDLFSLWMTYLTAPNTWSQSSKI